MKRARSYAAAAGVLALSLVLSSGLAAQSPPLDFDATGGIGVPAGTLADIGDLGPAFDIGVNIGVTDRFAVRVDGGAALYDGVDLGEPLGREGVNELDLDLIHLHAGGLYYLLPRNRDRSPFFATLEGSAGLTNFNVPRVATSVGTDAIEFEISELYFSTAGGVSLGYAVHEQVDLFANGRVHVVFGDESDTAELVQAVNDVLDEPVDGLDTMWSIPVTAGVRLHF